MVRISEDFLKQVETLRGDVFLENGLPSLRIKDEIRQVELKKRNFEGSEGESNEDKVLR